VTGGRIRSKGANGHRTELPAHIDASGDGVRDRWRARWESSLEFADFPGAVHADPEMTDWLGWTSAWDAIAAEFHEDLPTEIDRARSLERLVGEWRRATEHSFVFEDRGSAKSARELIDNVSRKADLACGLPAEGTKGRRRVKLMHFVDQCTLSGLSAWPDFDSLARDGGVIDDADPEYFRLVDWRALRNALADTDLSNLLSFSTKMENRPKLDRLVKAWGGKKAGAPANARRGAYVEASNVLKAIGDSTASPGQLKKEWSKHKRSR
jgi:hypothetical protein